jgi:hypothetical protein
MEVVGHHNDSICFDARVVLGKVGPGLLDHSPGLAQKHAAIEDLAQYTGAVLRADRDEIRSLFGVVEVSKPQRPALSSFAIHSLQIV